MHRAEVVTILMKESRDLSVRSQRYWSLIYQHCSFAAVHQCYTDCCFLDNLLLI